MMKKVLSVFLCVFFILSLFSFLPFHAETSAGFSCGFDQTQARREELIRLRVRCAGTSPVPAGFRIRVSFDGDAVRYVGTEAASALGNGTVETNEGSEEICSVYVCNPRNGYAPPLSGTVITFVFRVGADAPAGSTAFAVAMDQICDYGGNSLPGYSQSLALQIAPGKSSQAYLTDLVPSAGKLKPEFSSDVFEYRLSVGWQTKTVTFEADAGESGTVKASRKTLGGGGSDTPVTLTVTSADKASKQAYIVTVHRGEKPAPSKPEEPSVVGGEDIADSRKASSAPRRRHHTQKKSVRADVPVVRTEERNLDSEGTDEANPAQPVPEQVQTGDPFPEPTRAVDGDSASRVETVACATEAPSFAEEESPAQIRFVSNTMPSFLYKLAALLCCLAVCIMFRRRQRIAG